MTVLGLRSLCASIHRVNAVRAFEQARRNLTVLGIETSCDDTAAAILTDSGQVLGHVLQSQEKLHLKYGGIIPPIAGNQHRENIENVVQKCLTNANVNFKNIDAIAVTNRPGLQSSLLIGLRYAKYLARTNNKPLIPVHHMEAHALTVRMCEKVEFPFLCLLLSGGHCQLVFIKNVDDFYLLGETLDDAPGEAFDKIARRLKLRNMSQFEWINGGAAIEQAANEAQNADNFEFPLPLTRYRDCNFSFAGLKNAAKRYIRSEELDHGIGPDEIIPTYTEFCASFLKIIARHISNRTQRGIEYCQQENLFENSQDKSLVISGGVACNDAIFAAVSLVASHFGYKTYRPPKKYCSDNGVMIAWNGIEKIKHDNSCLNQNNIDSIDVEPKCTLGKSLIENVINANIKCKWVSISNVFPNST